MATFDRRTTFSRPDLADARLRGAVTADRFTEPAQMRVRTSIAPLRREARHDAPLETQALFGEPVRVAEQTEEGWSWCQLDADGYVGWMPTEALGPESAVPTHRVTSLRTFVYPGPNMKLPTEQALSFGSLVTVNGHNRDFAALADGGFVWAAHLAALTEHGEDDVVAFAERFIGVPYLWGGRSSLGLDCSALVQLACAACHIAALRDSDMQEAGLGRALADTTNLSGLTRGDLVFWKGHVGLMRDARTLLHANGHHMLVAGEPLTDAAARIAAKGGGPITSMRRLVG